MTRMPIRFKDANELVEFVNIVSDYDYSIELKADDRILDAKSLVGTIVLCDAEQLEVIVHAKECEELVNRIAVYA